MQADVWNIVPVLCRGDLIRILTKLLRRKSKIDHIIIETTGLADPGPVIQTFFTGIIFLLADSPRNINVTYWTQSNKVEREQGIHISKTTEIMLLACD